MTVPELRPGWTSALQRASRLGVVRAGVGLEALALVVEREARAKASNGSHAFGTPTPARPNEGPAEISGTLKRSVGHSLLVENFLGWETKVGPRKGFTPEYRRNGASADEYGHYLETGLRNGARYPWLGPAVDAARPEAIRAFAKVFDSTAWPVV